MCVEMTRSWYVPFSQRLLVCTHEDTPLKGSWTTLNVGISLTCEV